MPDLHRCIGILSLLVAACSASVCAAAATESEPNNSCATAQDLGALGRNSTLSVEGALKTPPSVPDMDFYRFTGEPGGLVRIRLSGSTDGVHTLISPVMGIFDATCQYHFDTYGFSYTNNLYIHAPQDGVFIVGITTEGDIDLNGSGPYAGTYSLAVTDLKPVGSIAGRIVAGESQSGLPGVSVQLLLCLDAACEEREQVGQQTTDYLGKFRFEQNFYGEPLMPGNYRIYAADYSEHHEPVLTPVFVVLGEQHRVLADISLKPVPVIGSLRGRIIDAVTGKPLSGSGAPHAQVFISGCMGFACSFANVSVDSTGRFLIEKDSGGWGLVAGAVFNVYVAAEQYQAMQVSAGPVDEGGHLDLGDLKLISNPVRFNVLKGCGSIPVSGGLCRYEVEITNGLGSPVKGAAWITVEANGLASYAWRSLFQAGAAREMQLAAATRTRRSSRKAAFEFEIPASVPTYAFICPTFWFGADPVNSQLAPRGEFSDYSLCVQRTVEGYKSATREQVDGLRKEARQHDAKRRALMMPKRQR